VPAVRRPAVWCASSVLPPSTWVLLRLAAICAAAHSSPALTPPATRAMHVGRNSMPTELRSLWDEPPYPSWLLHPGHGQRGQRGNQRGTEGLVLQGHRGAGVAGAQRGWCCRGTEGLVLPGAQRGWCCRGTEGLVLQGTSRLLAEAKGLITEQQSSTLAGWLLSQAL